MTRKLDAQPGKLDFISLFAGAGGLDLGFEDAGWNCLYGSDIDPAAVQTLRINQRAGGTGRLGQALFEQADIADVSGSTLLARIGRRRGDVAAIVGGPPCQSWSSAGHQRGFEDPRGRLFQDYVRIASEVDARWLVFENVRGLLTARGPDGVPGSALEHIRETLLQAGFQTEVELLNAADYGAPQRRVRLFMIGYRKGDRPPFPDATHARQPHLFDGNVRPWVPLATALAELAPPEAQEVFLPNAALRAQLEQLIPGSGVKSPGKAESTRPGGHWGYKQGAFLADVALPARTVTASAQQDWIRDPTHGLRRLTPRECAAIQTFPRDWEFCGRRADQYRLIGNAVPPRLAQALAASLRGHVEQAATAADPAESHQLNPLRPHLVSAIRYTIRDEARNGESRRAAAPRRHIRG